MFASKLFHTFLLAGTLAACMTDRAQGQPQAPLDQSVVSAVQMLISDLAETVEARRLSLSCGSKALRDCLVDTLGRPQPDGQPLSPQELDQLRGQLGTMSSYATNAALACPFAVGTTIELIRPTGRSLVIFNNYTCRQILFARSGNFRPMYLYLSDIKR